MKSHSHVRLLATPWTGAYQDPPSMGFSRQEYWSGLPVPSPYFKAAFLISSHTFSSVAQSCPTLCDPMNCSTRRLPVFRSSPRLTSIESVMPSSHLILCRPLFLLPPSPPSIRVFSYESTLRMRWPKYWSFSFSIIPSKEIQGLISFICLGNRTGLRNSDAWRNLKNSS